MLAVWCQPSTPTTRATVPTAIAVVIIFCLFLYLSHLEHTRSLCPSSILCLFFSFTIPFDLARLRTLHFIPDNRLITVLFAISVVGKAVILVLESTEKRHLLKKGFDGSAIETTGGIISRYLFWWINGLLWKGSKATLTVESLPVLADDIREASDPQQLEERWDKGNNFWPLVFLGFLVLTLCCSRQVSIKRVAMDLCCSFQMGLLSRRPASSHVFRVLLRTAFSG